MRQYFEEKYYNHDIYLFFVPIGLEIKVFNSINIFSTGNPYNLFCSTTDAVFGLLKLFYQNSLRNL